MTDHTPSPWWANGREIISGSMRLGKATTSDYLIAVANAKLMAAAPELRDTVRNLMELIEARAPEALHWSDMDSARAALAKAED